MTFIYLFITSGCVCHHVCPFPRSPTNGMARNVEAEIRSFDRLCCRQTTEQYTHTHTHAHDEYLLNMPPVGRVYRSQRLCCCTGFLRFYVPPFPPFSLIFQFCLKKICIYLVSCRGIPCIIRHLFFIGLRNGNSRLEKNLVIIVHHCSSRFNFSL